MLQEAHLSPELTPKISGLTIFPVKSMDGVSVQKAQLFSAGGLWGDRLWAVFDQDGEVVTGKNTPRIVSLRAKFSSDLSEVSFWSHGEPPASFSLSECRTGRNPRLDKHLSDYFGKKVELRCNERSGFPDYESNPGPSIVSTASLQEFCRWFPEIPLVEARRRFRTSVEIDGVPAFWEDRLFREKGVAKRFHLGNVEVHGMGPIMRCPVPTRNPDSGDVMRGFQRRFILARQKTLSLAAPESAARLADGYYMAVKTQVPDAQGKELSVGDRIALL